MWEMAALRWVGVNRSVLASLSLSLSASTSFLSCLAAAKTHKPVLTEANYSSLHLLQTGWNSSGVQHLCTQRHLNISLLLHIKTNWFAIKTHWAFEKAQSYEALLCHNPPKAADGQIYWRSTNQLMHVSGGENKSLSLLIFLISIERWNISSDTKGAWTCINLFLNIHLPWGSRISHLESRSLRLSELLKLAMWSEVCQRHRLLSDPNFTSSEETDEHSDDSCCFLL